MQNINKFFTFNTMSNISTSNGWGVKPFRIPGLVAESISQDLADKLLAKNLKILKNNITLYLSNTGDDSIADGSIDRPFKTIQECLYYIKCNYDTFGVTKIYIEPLEPYSVNSLEIRTGNKRFWNGVNFVGTNNNLNFNNGLLIEKSDISFTNCTFSDENSKKMLITVYGGWVGFSGTNTLNILNPGSSGIYANYNSLIDMNSNLVINAPNNFMYLSRCVGQSYIYFRANRAITLPNNKACTTLFYNYNQGFTECLSNFINSVEGKKYINKCNSVMSVAGKGIDYIPASLAGTSDNGSFFY